MMQNIENLIKTLELKKQLFEAYDCPSEEFKQGYLKAIDDVLTLSKKDDEINLESLEIGGFSLNNTNMQNDNFNLGYRWGIIESEQALYADSISIDSFFNHILPAKIKSESKRAEVEKILNSTDEKTKFSKRKKFFRNQARGDGI